MRVKSCFYALTAIVTGILSVSCNNTFNAGIPPPSANPAPVEVQPLRFSKPKKIAWADVKAVPVRPVVTRLAWDKLPKQPEDTTGYKPFKYPVQETRFNYDALPAKSLDIDKLPSHPLNFKTSLLPPPKLVKGIKLQSKNGCLYLLEVGGEQSESAVEATRLLRDKDGFLWIACSEGIYRYDGENLFLFLAFPDERSDFGMIQDGQGNIWLPDPGGPLMILEPGAGILKKSESPDVHGLQHLMLDDEQRVWATSQSDDVRIIDAKTKTVKILDSNNGLSKARRTAGLAKDKSGKIWISTGGGGIDIVDLANKQIKYLNQTNGLESNRVNNIVFDRKGRLWIGMYGGLVQVADPQKRCFQAISEIQSAAENVFVTCWSEDDQGRIWVGTTTGGTTAINLEKRMVRHIDKNQGLASNRILDISSDRNGQVWIGTGSGLNMLANEDAINEHSGSDEVVSLMEDGNGQIWQGTFHGINILNRKNHSSRRLGVEQGLASDTVYFLEQKNGLIFISTAASMEIVDTVKKTIIHFNGNYSNILFDKAGRIYFLDGAERGINLYDPKNQTLKHFGEDVLQLDDAIFFMCLDTLGRIWFSNSIGEVRVIDPDAGTIQTLTNIQPEKRDNWVHFLTDSHGNIWIGTGRGIYIADIKNKKLVYFSAAQGLISNKVTSMVQYGKSVYAGTNRGITVITPPADGIATLKGWQAVSYALTKQNPVSYNADMITRDGAYWLGDAGASALTLTRNDSAKSFPYIRGISVFDHPLYFFDKSGFDPSRSDTLWQPNGESRLPGEATPVNTSYAFRNGFRWDDVAGPGYMPVNLRIPYNQNFLHFHYGDLNLAPHDTTRYRYILNGFDKQWSGATSDTITANYMNLPPGSYSFGVIKTNPDNSWSRPAIFSFVIDPPWWKTWWAYVIYAVLIAGAISGFVRYRSLQLIKEKRELEKKVHQATEEIVQQKEEIAAQRDSLETQRNDLEKALTELKAAQTQLIQSEKMASLGELTAGIAHEIQNPLNFVNNFSEVSAELVDELDEELNKGDIAEAKAIASDVKQNLQKIRHHGKRADAIVKGMLQHSRASTGEKQLTNMNVLADEFFKLAYQGLRAKDKEFNCEMVTHFDPDLPRVNVVQQDMGRVMLNLFNNAFYAASQKAKTAGSDYKPAVEIRTFAPPPAGEGWAASVRDNGIGIPDAIKEKIMQPFFTTKPTGEGTGLGLSLTYDMVVKGHGGSIEVNSVEGEGSEFVIVLPI